MRKIISAQRWREIQEEFQYRCAGCGRQSAPGNLRQAQRIAADGEPLSRKVFPVCRRCKGVRADERLARMHWPEHCLHCGKVLWRETGGKVLWRETGGPAYFWCEECERERMTLLEGVCP